MPIGTVLIVDDSKTSRRLLRNILEKNNFEVLGEAENGEEGWMQFRKLNPDIITMDITMPKMDGIEALSLIHRDDAHAKVIMITAAGQNEKMVEAIRRGAYDFITKPLDEEKVIKVMIDAIEDGK
jgi:two-component system chemotaxis response regulator CheY